MEMLFEDLHFAHYKTNLPTYHNVNTHLFSTSRGIPNTLFLHKHHVNSTVIIHFRMVPLITDTAISHILVLPQEFVSSLPPVAVTDVNGTEMLMEGTPRQERGSEYWVQQVRKDVQM